MIYKPMHNQTDNSDTDRRFRAKRRPAICQSGCFPIYCQHIGTARRCPVYKKLSKIKGV